MWPFMHPSNFIEADRPHSNEIEAAARELYSWGELHGWWPESVTCYEVLDPVGKDEFEAIAERILMAASAARRGVAPNTP